jgi:LPS-assembly lipoprotein
MWWSDVALRRGSRGEGAPRAAFAHLSRDGLRAIAVVALAAALGACGFHLRGDADYPFATIFVNAPPAPPLATELARTISAASKTRVLDTAVGADVILEVPIVLDDKDVLSLSSGGSVREYQLVKRVQFRLHDKEGNDWMPAGEIVARRSYTFNETQVLARDLQEARLLREMQTDAVQQIIRRLQASRKPT